ncbi:MAG: 16S rRNA (guanine(966)-N(2))-methyltransferase RsmD [Chloroflexi bacterium]|nr:16S rRNA (guanine(966)-N(2))-methyltransferase RsmD [Chloroflexota bacterium]
MRVIAGSVKGRRLKSPRGSIRPTTELVRGAVFSILQPMVSDRWRALDLYAGSGALGIEALSRGASWVDFVENNPRRCAVIKENLALTGFTSQAKVYCCSVDKALSILHEVYDVVMLDPPYSDVSFVDTLRTLLGSHLVGVGSTIIVQWSSHQTLPPEMGRFELSKVRHYGDTCLSFYRQEANN